MSSKEDILNKIRSHKQDTPPKPVLKIQPHRSTDKIGDFKNALAAVAAQCVVLENGDSVGSVIKQLYPDAINIASSIPDIECVTLNPETLENAAGLNGVDVGIVKGCFGVIENGAVWIRQDVRHKAIYFISEALVILMPRNEIVENMHEAYRRPEVNDDFEYGCFISGPSKTADIEQALVIGAHGAKGVTVILV